MEDSGLLHALTMPFMRRYIEHPRELLRRFSVLQNRFGALFLSFILTVVS